MLTCACASLLGCAGPQRSSSVENHTIDSRLLAQVQHHYPETSIRPSPGKTVIFEEVRRVGSVSTEQTSFHVIIVRRLITNMLAPRGLNDLLIIDDHGALLKKESLTSDVKLEGSILYLATGHVGVDLASPVERRLWSRDEIDLLDAENALGFWCERIRSAIADLSDSGPQSFIAALQPEWNSAIIGINILYPPSTRNESISIAQFAARYQYADITLHRPTISDMQFSLTRRTEYDHLESPWIGVIRATIRTGDQSTVNAGFLLAGAQPGS